jgi:hypothetical protein
VVAAVATAGALVVPLLSSTPAQADPRQHTSQLVAVGSDTLNEVTNALSGEAGDIDYTPVHSDNATGRLQVTSWGGLAPGDPQDTDTCIAPRRLLNAFQRPNGSGQGRAALSRSIDGAAYSALNPAGDASCAAKSTQGIVDFSRSSSLPGTTGTQIVYVPFARDALSYGYYAVNGATPITNFTTAELTTIFQGGGSPGSGNGTTVRGVLVIPCDIQSGSGTRNDWAGKVGATTAQIQAASASCTGAGTNGQVEENHLDQMKSRADDWATAHSGSPAEFVVGHTASSFIAQKNGKSPNHISAGTDLGSVNFAGTVIAPYNAGPPATANTAFYDGSTGSTYGRIVFYAVPWSKIGIAGTTGAPGSGQFLGIKQLFRPSLGSGGIGSNGGTAEICKQTSTIANFGFLQLTNATTGDMATATNECGGLANQRGLESNS